MVVAVLLAATDVILLLSVVEKVRHYPQVQQEELEKYFDSDGHKMGGYASFTQSDPRDYNRNQKSGFQLLQIDTDQQIMFGDSGIAHVFINPDDLAVGRFENAYFYWDCC